MTTNTLDSSPGEFNSCTIVTLPSYLFQIPVHTSRLVVTVLDIITFNFIKVKVVTVYQKLFASVIDTSHSFINTNDTRNIEMFGPQP